MDIQNENLDPFVGFIREKFQQSETARLYDEKRWLKAYRNYRGLYGPEMAFRDNEKSKVFVKITKTKVLAAFGQIIEVLFSSGKFPIGIRPTTVPEGIDEYAHITKVGQPQQANGQAQPNGQDMESPYGFAGDGGELPKGATAESLMKDLSQQYKNLGFEEGPSPDNKSMPQIEPADIAAGKMQKLIHDQLEESEAITILRHVFFEMCLLGTGILKGPFTTEKTQYSYASDEETGALASMEKSKVVPSIEAVSCWDFYSDPNATSMNDAEYVIQRHSLNKEQFAALAKKPLFKLDAIRECLEMGPNYQTRGYESSLYDRENVQTLYKNRFEVLEYWGLISKDIAKQLDLEFDDELDVVSVNVWICGNKVLRCVENPFTPKRIPYMVCPYELNPYQFFGVGIPENMQDSQQVMNGHARMEENLMMFDRFRQLADEATGIPSYSHGTTGVQSTTRTAAGMSMLMGAAALSIKTVIKNIDDYLLKPLGQSLFHWNMQFNIDRPEIKGDLDIKAQGTSSLMQKEVRSQRLMTFMQTASNPSLAPFVKWHTCLKEVAKSLDIDPDQLINDPEKAAIYAHIMGMANGNQQNTSNSGQQGPMANMGGVPAGANQPNVSGLGNGQIGVGNVPLAGETGFTGTPQEPEGIS